MPPLIQEKAVILSSCQNRAFSLMIRVLRAPPLGFRHSTVSVPGLRRRAALFSDAEKLSGAFVVCDVAIHRPADQFPDPAPHLLLRSCDPGSGGGCDNFFNLRNGTVDRSD